MELTQEILLNNRLIAVFMGWEENRSGYYPHPQYELDYKGRAVQTTVGDYKSDKPLYVYHQSWDWLMPVVEKIESLPEVDYIKMYSEHKRIYDFIICLKEDGTDPTFEISTDSKMESVYTCVIEFVKWHNAQQNK